MRFLLLFSLPLVILVLHQYDLTEGDVLTIMSQFGEIVDCNLVRDKETGKSKGFVLQSKTATK
jgi:RNA recognition motif-containing protein